jgi:hypothetical protein
MVYCITGSGIFPGLSVANVAGMATMKKILTNNLLWGIAGYTLIFILYLILQYTMEVSWLASLEKLPVTDFVIDFFFFSSIMVFLASGFPTRLGIVAGLVVFLTYVWFEMHHGITLETIVTFVSVGAIGMTNFIIVKHNKEARKKRDSLIDELRKTQGTLEKSLSEVKTLDGLIPICASCKQIRDDKGYWEAVEQYIKKHSTAEFTHSICPACMAKLYPEVPVN